MTDESGQGQQPNNEGSLPPAFQRFNNRAARIAAERTNASEYGEVMIGHRWIDVNLTEAIRSRFVEETKGAAHKLFDYPGGLSSFSARVYLGRCMGIFGPITYADLRTINEIRNAFVHPSEDESGEVCVLGFDHPAISGLCKKLRFIDHMLHPVDKSALIGSARELFNQTVGNMALCLWMCHDMHKEFGSPPEVAAAQIKEFLP